MESSGGSGSDVRARFFDHRGQPRGGEVGLAVPRHVFSVDQAVADRDGGFLLVWTGLPEGEQTTGIFVRRYLRDGTPAGSVIRASVPNESHRWSGVISAGRNGKFAVAWRSVVPGSGPDGYDNAVGRTFDANGMPLTPEILLAGLPASQAGDDRGDAFPVALALALDGTLTALIRNVSHCLRTYLVRLGPGHAKPSTLNVGFAGCDGFTWDHSRASLALGPDGSGLAAWRGRSLWAARFTPNGTRRGRVIQLSNVASDAEVDPMAAVQADGSFVVAWATRDDFDGSGDGDNIFARAFDAAGRPRGGNFQVNTTTAGHQRLPVIGSASRGPVVVVWAEDPPSGFGLDVIARVLPVSAIR